MSSSRPRNPFDLSGKVALVTGANSGLGLGFARGIAKAGGDLVIWGRRAQNNEQAARELREHGVRVWPQTVDVADEQRVMDGIEAAVAEMGRLDCVIANAGISTHYPSWLATPTEAYHELLAINLHGAVYTLREAARHMVARAEAGDPGGSLITCGSLTVTAGVPRIEHYSAAKGALMAVTRSMAVEFGPQGIRVNMVLPGRIESQLSADNPDQDHERRRRAMTERNPIRRYGTPADLEGIAVYLMSDASAYHTGDMITIDGGLSITLI
jgi:NAD(P)-dependent dehydrogenase (short-subunit alcohol dehydrogenase family)